MEYKEHYQKGVRVNAQTYLKIIIMMCNTSTDSVDFPFKDALLISSFYINNVASFQFFSKSQFHLTIIMVGLCSYLKREAPNASAKDIRSSMYSNSNPATKARA